MQMLDGQTYSEWLKALDSVPDDSFAVLRGIYGMEDELIIDLSASDEQLEKLARNFDHLVSIGSGPYVDEVHREDFSDQISRAIGEKRFLMDPLSGGEVVVYFSPAENAIRCELDDEFVRHEEAPLYLRDAFMEISMLLTRSGMDFHVFGHDNSRHLASYTKKNFCEWREELAAVPKGEILLDEYSMKDNLYLALDADSSQIEEFGGVLKGMVKGKEPLNHVVGARYTDDFDMTFQEYGNKRYEVTCQSGEKNTVNFKPDRSSLLFHPRGVFTAESTYSMRDTFLEITDKLVEKGIGFSVYKNNHADVPLAVYDPK